MPTRSRTRPCLYQVNIRVWLTELSRALGRCATLDDIPNAALDEFAAQGFDWIWLLSVWQTGAAGRLVSRTHPAWQREFAQILPDLTAADIAGSGFAIADYRVHEILGGDPALARLRERLRQRGIKLMLDFVANHLALDHPWSAQRPDYFVSGGAADLALGHAVQVATASGQRTILHGRDPYFPGWPDTLQLDYGNPALHTAMIGELTRIADQCDGVRCDMAMLILPEVFERTWGRTMSPFWPRAISSVRERLPDFLFLAEVYWDLEWTLAQQGFDYCYDKRLYDRLRDGRADSVRDHFRASQDDQNHRARFLENHDEPRAAATFDLAQHRAAAVLTYLAPGLRFFHQGQLAGYCVRPSPHLVRAPHESDDPALSAFYRRLLNLLRQPAIRAGDWRLLECQPAWEGNWTHDACIVFVWELATTARLLVAVNYSDHQSQARIKLPCATGNNAQWRCLERFGEATPDTAGATPNAPDGWCDLSPWESLIWALI